MYIYLYTQLGLKVSMESMEESYLTKDEKDEFRMGAGGGESKLYMIIMYICLNWIIFY